MKGPLVRVTRNDSDWPDRLRSYVIELDGRRMGRLSRGQRQDLGVRPGHHRLRMRIDWSGSPEIEFDAENGEVIEFVCGPRPDTRTIWRILRASFSRSRWIVLERVEN